jgi:hypothetical protein
VEASGAAQARDDKAGQGLPTFPSCRRPPDQALGIASNRPTTRRRTALGRPLVDRVAGSHLHNLKELRPGSSAHSEVRILIIFDARHNAVLLPAGDKAGQWNEWYQFAIPEAEALYDKHLKEQLR